LLTANPSPTRDDETRRVDGSVHIMSNSSHFTDSLLCFLVQQLYNVHCTNVVQIALVLLQEAYTWTGHRLHHGLKVKQMWKTTDTDTDIAIF